MLPRRFPCPIEGFNTPHALRVAIAQHVYDVHKEAEPLLLLPEWNKLRHFGCPIDGCGEARFDVKTFQQHLQEHDASDLAAETAELKRYLCSQAIIVSSDPIQDVDIKLIAGEPPPQMKPTSSITLPTTSTMMTHLLQPLRQHLHLVFPAKTAASFSRAVRSFANIIKPLRARLNQALLSIRQVSCQGLVI
jgi:hypothetical protein